MHARLSKDSIYRRYFGARPRLSPADIRRFTSIEEEWRFALVGVTTTGELVAVARYDGRAGSRSAEIAVIVDDALQRSGLGRSLLQRLVDVARLQGLEVLVADVLEVNRPMIRLLRTLGLPMTAVSGGGVVTVNLDLGSIGLSRARLERARAHVTEAAAMRAAGQGPVAQGTGDGSATGGSPPAKP